MASRLAEDELRIISNLLIITVHGTTVSAQEVVVVASLVTASGQLALLVTNDPSANPGP